MSRAMLKNPPTPAPLAGSDLLTLASLSPGQIGALLATAGSVKSDIAQYRGALSGKSVILLFEKPSLRTRVTFEVGPAKMGAAALYFDYSKERIGERESVKDYGRNLERWVDCIVARVFSHEILVELAGHCDVPVINALSDQFHPCQALADVFTLSEQLGGPDALRGFRLSYIGDGNNVCHSLMHAAGKLGMHLQIICPPGYEPDEAVIVESRGFAETSGGSIELSQDPAAVAGAGAIYTDTWVSMGEESEKAERLSAFSRYRVDEKLMAMAARGAYFMHCLPAHRGLEVTDAVIDSPRSIVYDQAENRMHVQNALLLHVLGAAI
jgi:ornithine carbamoyltransferase